MFYRAPLDVMPALRTATTHCISAMRRTREANAADKRENASRLPPHDLLVSDATIDKNSTREKTHPDYRHMIYF